MITSLIDMLDMLSSITVIYIERSYANRILQVSMDKIIDIFGKRKHLELFVRSVHVLYIFCYVLG